MLQTKFKYENKQRAITQKLSKRDKEWGTPPAPGDNIIPPVFDGRIKSVSVQCILFPRTFLAKDLENMKILLLRSSESGTECFSSCDPI